MSSRKIPILAVGVPLLIFFVVLIIGMLQSGRGGGRPGVNDTLGEVDVTTDVYSDFQITTLDGRELRLSDLRGSIVMVDFWSSWCAACRAEAADLAAVYLEYIDAPVEFVGVAIWDATGDVLQHIERYGVTYPNILDERGVAAVGYGVRGVPEKFFLDGDGQIVLKLIGPVSAEKLRETIDSLLVAQRDG